MKSRGANIAGFPILRWLTQLLSALCIVAMLTFFVSKSAAAGVVIGGLITLISNGLFIWFAYRYRGARQASQMIHSMYFGETVKLIVTAVLLVAVFMLVNKSIAQFSLIGFVAMSVISWLISVRLLNQSRHS